VLTDYMRNFVFIGLLFITLTLHAQEDEFNLKNAGDYNNFIMKEMTAAVQKNFEYLAFVVHSEAYDQMDDKRKEVVNQIIEARGKVSQMPPLDGDTRLRDESVEVLNEYKNAFDIDYKQIISLKKKSKDSFEAMKEYFKAEDEAEEKLNKATQKLRKAQRIYASKNNMTVVDGKSDDELERKMGKAKATNLYWRSVFIQYFKVSEAYDLMWDALNQRKASVIDNERIKVVKVINNTLPDLKAIPVFNGDTEFRDQTIGIIEYYKQVAEVQFAKITERLKKTEMTQEDIDAVNAIINQCNADHERLAYNWNMASQDLFRKNVEKE
jgi:hypothetical protein